jgi:hypothetical protein
MKNASSAKRKSWRKLMKLRPVNEDVTSMAGLHEKLFSEKLSTSEELVNIELLKLIDDFDTAAGDFIGLATFMNERYSYVSIDDIAEFKASFNNVYELARLIHDAAISQNS